MDLEDLFGFVVVVIIIVASIAKTKKMKVEDIRKRAAAAGQATVEQTLAEWFNVPSTPKTEAEEPEQVHVPVPDMMPSTHMEKRPVVAPRVKTTVEVKERPSHMIGSLGEDTHEGMHPCDEHDDAPLQGQMSVTPLANGKPGIELDWSGENMVKAFIMQEVLTRPCERRRRA